MASAEKRAQVHDASHLKLSDGDMAEIIFPVANPGDAGYVNPRHAQKNITDNTGGKATPKAGKNY